MKEKTGIIAGILTFLGFSALCVWHHAFMPDPLLSSTPSPSSSSSLTPHLPGLPAALPTSPSVTESSPVTVPSTKQETVSPTPQVQAVPSIQAPPLQPQFLLPLRGKVIEFLAGSDKLTLKGREALDTLLVGLHNQPVQQIEITGHTDNLGDEDNNRNLSQRRAEAVKRYFISQGIAENYLITQGYGSSLPIADNATAEGRQRNPRTEIIIHRTAARS